MSALYVFDSPGVKSREGDPLYNRRTVTREKQVLTISNSGSTPTPENSMLQWITGVMYNNNVLMYNDKIWTNN